MNNSDYTFPGIAAIAVAILFPIYWIGLIVSGAFDSGAHVYQSVADFTSLDVVFIVLGLLTIYVYFSLKRLLNDQYGFSGVNLPLNILIGASVIYFVGLSGLDIVMGIFGDGLGLGADSFVLNANLIIGVGGLVVFGVADILMGVLLLKNSSSESNLIKVLAIIAIIQGAIEITIIFSPALIVVFPIMALIFAMLFMHKPDVLEVI